MSLYIILGGAAAALTKELIDRKRWGWAAFAALTCVFLIVRMPQ